MSQSEKNTLSWRALCEFKLIIAAQKMKKILGSSFLQEKKCAKTTLFIYIEHLPMRREIWLGTATQIHRRHQAAANRAAWQG